MNQLRPISLYNIIYNIIMKILANRFKAQLRRFISLYKSTFVPSKNIQDNTIMAHELLMLSTQKRVDEVLWLSR